MMTEISIHRKRSVHSVGRDVGSGVRVGQVGHSEALASHVFTLVVSRTDDDGVFAGKVVGEKVSRDINAELHHIAVEMALITGGDDVDEAPLVELVL